MTKASNSEKAKRINAALVLIKKHGNFARASESLAAKCKISQRQAYRYVKEAESIGRKIPIPELKIVFTVKLSRELILKLRKYATKTGQHLSEVVTQALEKFFKGPKGGRRKTI